VSRQVSARSVEVCVCGTRERELTEFVHRDTDLDMFTLNERLNQ